MSTALTIREQRSLYVNPPAHAPTATSVSVANTHPSGITSATPDRHPPVWPAIRPFVSPWVGARLAAVLTEIVGVAVVDVALDPGDVHVSRVGVLEDVHATVTIATRPRRGLPGVRTHPRVQRPRY